MKQVVLVIPDSGPLISLSLAGRLNLLLRLGVPIYVVDQVFYECTRDPDKPGAAAIRDFCIAHPNTVRIAETFVGKAAATERERQGSVRQRGLGEAAVAEFFANMDQIVDPRFPVLILFEDSDVRRINIVVQGNAHLVSTWAFLLGLEETGIIESAGAIWQEIEMAGRHPAKAFVDQPAPESFGQSDWKPRIR